MEAGADAGVLIREARAADLPALVRLLNQLSLDDDREDPEGQLAGSYRAALAALLTDDQAHLFVASAGDAIIGSCTVFVLPNLSFRGRPFTLIDNVVVDEGWRGRGVGRALLERARRIACESGSYKLALTSNARRDQAHRFYEKLGFRATHRGFTLTP